MGQMLCQTLYKYHYSQQSCEAILLSCFTDEKMRFREFRQYAESHKINQQWNVSP